MPVIIPYTKAFKGELIAIMKRNVPTYFDLSEIEQFSTYLDSEIDQYFVVKNQNDDIVGCGGINFEKENTAVISWDMIDPAYHKMGYGRALMEYRLNYIASLPTITNVIVRTSQHTYLYYQKFGFLLNFVEKDYWADGLDLYHMEKTL